MTTAIEKYSPIEAALTELDSKYRGIVFDVATIKGMREAEEAKQREIQRLANELNDGRKMLQTFVDRFGKREEFLGIAALIKEFLQ